MQSLHWYKALHAVDPNWLNNFVSADLHCGHIGGVSEITPDIFGGAIPYLFSFIFPASVIQSVVHAGESMEVIFILV